MIFHYHRESDMLCIKLGDGTSRESEEVAPGVVLDFDAQNQLVGIEIEDASKHADLSRLELLAVPFTDLVVGDRAGAER
jgi:uncharacterized protein YuzE